MCWGPKCFFIIIGAVHNPWKVKISYDNIAPWVGEATRKSDYVLNTEHKKVRAFSKPDGISTKPCEISHEDVLDALHCSKKVCFDADLHCCHISLYSIFFLH